MSMTPRPDGESRFEVTADVLGMLREREFSPSLLRALETLVGVAYEDEQSFLKAICALDPAPGSDEEAAAILRCADLHFRQAVALLERAYRIHMRGRLADAIRLYKRSIRLFPTAEAHTFLGWAYSFQNRYQDAIAECERAILADPDFGNPYNDIGSYLIAMERLDEAIPWLEKATEAPRYGPRHFPWVNLGRVYEALGDPDRALEQYMEAHWIAPKYEFALKSISRLCGPPERLN